MTTFVQLSLSEPAYELVILLNAISEDKLTVQEEKKKEEDESKGEQEAAEEEDLELTAAQGSDLGKLVANGEVYKLLSNSFFALQDKIMASSVEVIDAAFSIAFSLWNKVKDVKEANSLIKKWTSMLVTSPEDNTTLKFQLLTVLFNSLPTNHSHRFALFTTILNLARTTNNSALLNGQLDFVETWMDDWALPKQDKAQMYLVLSMVVEEQGKAKQKQQYLIEYLKCMSESKGDDRDATKPHAATAVIAAIKSFSAQPEEELYYDCGILLELSVVKDLALDVKYRNVFTLLRIFARDTVNEYLEFTSTAANKEFVAKLEMDHDAILQKLRTLTICNLGMDSQTIPYEVLQKALKVDTEEGVEAAVIDAVMSQRLDAKIDQKNKAIIVERTTQRAFQNEDWAALAQKLEKWNMNVGHTLSELQYMQNSGQG